MDQYLQRSAAILPFGELNAVFDSSPESDHMPHYGQLCAFEVTGFGAALFGFGVKCVLQKDKTDAAQP